MNSRTLALIALLAIGARASAQQGQPMAHDMKMPMPTAEITKAVAVITPTASSKVAGMVVFVKADKGVKITVDVTGLTPGKHGFHIHEFGDCSAADYTSAGPHFMMAGESHGAPDASMSHNGDMGNLEADATGKAHLELTDPNVSFSGATSIIGRAIVIHDKEDDLKTQPTGNSGARIACATIGIAKQ
jgi:superoxide dismutase, Cu-Zn family